MIAASAPIAVRAKRDHCVNAVPASAAVWNGELVAWAAQSSNARLTVLGDRPPVYRLCQTCSIRSRLSGILMGGFPVSTGSGFFEISRLGTSKGVSGMASFWVQQ